MSTISLPLDLEKPASVSSFHQLVSSQLRPAGGMGRGGGAWGCSGNISTPSIALSLNLEELLAPGPAEQCSLFY